MIVFYFFLIFFSLDINECKSTPCLNDGLCVDGINSYRCKCKENYVGENCETSKYIQCSKTKRRLFYPFSFVICCCDVFFLNCCHSLIAGINECNKMPCLNGGKCVDLGDVKHGDHYYKCVCAAGFTGKNCETNINECDPLPCQNGGNCVDGVNDYTCQCPAGYTGKNCETGKVKMEYNGYMKE